MYSISPPAAWMAANISREYFTSTALSSSPWNNCMGVSLKTSASEAFHPPHTGTAAAQDVFQGCLKIENGYCYANEAPGWGIEVDEELALEFPWNGPNSFDYHWGQTRKPDGSIIKP